jgi:hypothetical protein
MVTIKLNIPWEGNQNILIIYTKKLISIKRDRFLPKHTDFDKNSLISIKGDQFLPKRTDFYQNTLISTKTC